MTTPIIAEGAQGLRDIVGTELGPGEWTEITQDRVNLFADATGDHQWIHVDEARAAEGPFGGTIAHGFLTLSLLPLFVPELVDLRGFVTNVNYGCDRVRFPAPVRVGSRVRASGRIASVEDVPGGVQMKLELTVEAEGVAKPVAVVESLTRHYV